ncbi:MAG: NUDIX domain-containing protein [Nocardioides sp.]
MTAPFPPRLAAAGVLITGPGGCHLLVRTHNRTGLVLPGGMVEPDEPPAAAAEREVREEVGLDVRVTRLLTVQHRTAERGFPERLMFVFDCPSYSERPALTLQAEEIAEVHWLTTEEAVARHVEGGRSRIGAAFEARRSGTCVYVDAERSLPAQTDDGPSSSRG